MRTPKLLVTLLLLGGCLPLQAAPDKKAAPAKKDSTAQVSAYQKLFKDKKNVVHQAGLFPMHLVDGVLYAEVPKTFEGRDFALHTRIDAISSLSYGYPGKPVNNGLIFRLDLRDSTLLLTSSAEGTTAADPKIQEALDRANLKTTLYAFPVKAHTPDSSAWVVDLTSLFLTSDKRIASLNSSSMLSSASASFSKENSYITALEGSPQRSVVRVSAQYNVSTSTMGFTGVPIPMTAVLHMSLTPHQESQMKPVEADARLGTHHHAVTTYDAQSPGARKTYLASKWDLERQGKLVFYIDTLLPPAVYQGVQAGIEAWNPAFEKIGKPGLLEVRPFPRADSLFNAFDGRFNCVHFVQSHDRSLNYSLGRDTQTGEITNASIFLGTEYLEHSQRLTLLALAAADPDARHLNLPPALLTKVMKADMMSAIGACLGLGTNHAASFAYPADSLRSPSFTQKYGVASTVMKGQMLNKVAQPGDKERGVVLVQDFLGPYDYYAIRFLYDREHFVPDWDNPFLRYTKPGYASVSRDPYGFGGNNASDPVKASRYTLQNLEYVTRNAHLWIDRPEAGEGFKQLFIDFIWLEVYEQFAAPARFIGGAYTTEAYAGDPRPLVVPISKEVQKECLQFILQQSLQMDWLNANQVLRHHSGPVSDITEFLLANVYNNALFTKLGYYSLAVETPYPYQEIVEDLYAFALDLIRAKGELPKSHQVFLTQFTSFLKRNVSVVGQNSPLSPGGSMAFAPLTTETEATLPRTTTAKYYSKPDREAFHYQMLERLLAHTKAAAKAADPDRRAYFAHLRLQLEKLF